jgi:hypothetical protein
MEQQYINLVEEWCEILEYKAFAKYHGPHSKNEKTTYFWFKINKKYTKIIQTTHGQDSVHAFVDNKTLDIYKASSWNAPAKGKRFNLLENFDRVLEICEPNGGYLYASRKVYA